MKSITREEADPRAQHLFVPNWNKSVTRLNTRVMGKNDCTKALRIKGTASYTACVYCARMANAVESEQLTDMYGNAAVVGYACACKEACDEREVRGRLRDLQHGYNVTRNSIERELPKPNVEALRNALVLLIQKGSYSPSRLGELGTELEFEA